MQPLETQPPGVQQDLTGIDTALAEAERRAARAAAPAELCPDRVPGVAQQPDQDVLGASLGLAELVSRPVRHSNAGSQRSGLPHIGVQATRGPRDHGRTATDYDNPYGYLWWIDGERPRRFYAFGNLGQYTYVDPVARVVVVRVGSDWGVNSESWLGVFREVADELAGGSPRRSVAAG